MHSLYKGALPGSCLQRQLLLRQRIELGLDKVLQTLFVLSAGIAQLGEQQMCIEGYASLLTALAQRQIEVTSRLGQAALGTAKVRFGGHRILFQIFL